MREVMRRITVLSITVILLNLLAAPHSLAAEVTKSVRILKSNGEVYPNALVQAVWYVPEGKTENKSSVMTTDSNGIVSISYPSDITYGYIDVQPASGDTTNAFTRLDSFHDISSSTLEIKLSKADLLISILNSDNSPASAGSTFNSVKQTFTTLRTGILGLSSEDIDAYISEDEGTNNVASASPAEGVLDQFFVGRYFTKRKTESGWEFKFYLDRQMTQQALPIDGVHVFKFRNYNVQINLKNSSGQGVALDAGEIVYISGSKDTTEDTQPANNQYNYVESKVNNTGIWRGAFVNPGKYKLLINPQGSHTVPYATGPLIWVNSEGKVSSTSATSGFSESLNLDFALPQINVKFSLYDSESPTSLVAFSGFLEKKSGSEYVFDENFHPSYIGSVNGKASLSIPDGEYRIRVGIQDINRPESTHYLTVQSGTITMKDIFGDTILPSGSIYELRATPPNIRIKLIESGVPISNTFSYFRNRSSGDNVYFSTNSQGMAFSRLPNGTYDLSVSPSGKEASPRGSGEYEVIIVGGSVTSARNKITNSAVAPIDGVYNFGLSEPNVVLALKEGGATPTSGRYEIRIYQVDTEKKSFTNRTGQPSFTMKFVSTYLAGARLPAGTYRFAVSSLGSNGFISGASENCEVNLTSQASCIINIPNSNLTFSVKSQSGNLLTDNYYISLSNLVEGYSELNSCCFYPNYSSGKFSGKLQSGEYSMQLIPTNGSSSIGGRKTLRISVVDGVVTRVFDTNENSEVSKRDGEFEFSLTKNNFKGNLKIDGIATSLANIQVSGINKSFEFWAKPKTDGTFDLSFEDGQYLLRVLPTGTLAQTRVPTSYTIKVENSNIVEVKREDDSITTPSSGVYSLTLLGPNVSGKLQFSGQTFADLSGNIAAYSLSSDGKYFGENIKYGSLSADGSYVLRLSSGQYVFELSPYNPRGSYSSNICTVPTSGSVVCDTTLPSNNLKFDVYSTGTTKVNGSVYALISRDFANSKSFTNWIPNPNSNLSFSTSLLDGDYTLRLQPSGDLQGKFVSSWYKITVASGVVSSITSASGSIPEKTSEIYKLGLKNPAISGTVVTDDGVTPYPRSNVYAYSDVTSFGVGVDVQGRFAIDTDKDGKYELYADPGYADVLFSRSSSEFIDVTSGVGSNQVVLKLRKPNLTGTIRGPTGIASENNWLNIRKKDANGNFNYLPRGIPRATNSSGKFSYYLDPGTYRIEARADSNAKGARTISGDCIILVGQNTVCDFNLASSNLKINVTDGTSATVPRSSGWLYFQQGTTRPAKDFEWINTDVSGSGSAALEDGTWTLILNPPADKDSLSSSNFTLTVAGGVVTSVKDSLGTEITKDSSGVYGLPLSSANIIGSITFAGTKVTHWNHVTIKRKSGDFFYEVNSRGADNGSFGFRVDPGIYRVEARPYFGDNEDRTLSRSSECEVLQTGTVTCNVALRTPNFLGTVKTASGTNFSEANIQLFVENLQKEKGENWEYWLNLNSGKFGAYLENGTYRLNVQPNWNLRAQYSERNYRVTVSGGLISSVINLLSNETVTATSDGRYPLVLGTPGLKGTVLMPGASTEPVSNIQIIPIDNLGRERWEYSTTSDEKGRFGLTLPDGNWNLRARTWGSGKNFTNSAAVPIKVVAGALEAPGDITIRMRTPNIWGVVVKPGSTNPLPQVNVNINMNGAYYYAYTDESGQFGAYIEETIPSDCGDRCSISLSTWQSADYTSKRYTFSSLGNKENLAIGGVNTLITVLQPITGGTIPNKWGYVALEEFDGSNYIWQPGMHTNELGKVGFSLTSGKKYRLTAYPSWEKEGSFSPKVLVIDNFNETDSATVTMTFDSPNLFVNVKDRRNNLNTFGWYEIYKLNTDVTPNAYQWFRYGRLDLQGRGAQFLSDGSYKITFWPSEKSIGISKSETLTVTSGIVSGGSNLSVTLPAGNVSGVISKEGLVIAGATVAAVADADSTKVVSTVTLSDGSYELSLDMGQSWTLRALDPITTARGSLSLPSEIGGSTSTTLTNKNISIVVP